ncbi:MAG: exonuclease domain-containing protein [Eubacteriales bacterium]|nr:exonuclease domain-containing protein [Eubacteriales bacterium]
MEETNKQNTKNNTGKGHRKRNRHRSNKKPIATIAYIDTEFNAFDYYGQNGGSQEIIQIGAVVVRDGKQLDGFNTFCALKKGHVISKRTVKLTGIKESDLKGAPAFPEALEALNTFFDRFGPEHIFAYGSEDRIQMLNTARQYNIDRDELRYAENIEDNMKTVSTMLKLKRKSNLTLSVKDLCEICEVNADRPHDAYNDAIYLAECTEIIKRGKFDPERVEGLLDRKNWMSNYRMSRRIKECRESVILTDEELAPVRAMIAVLQENGDYPDYQLQALFDDLLMITGRIPGIDNN